MNRQDPDIVDKTRALFIKSITDEKPDIICMQEPIKKDVTAIKQAMYEYHLSELTKSQAIVLAKKEKFSGMTELDRKTYADKSFRPIHKSVH